MSATESENASEQNAELGSRDLNGLGIDELRKEIDWLDAEILRLVKRRVEVSKTVGAIRMANGGPRIVVGREMAILDRYRDLGPEGRPLAMALLNLGRGRLGHS